MGLLGELAPTHQQEAKVYSKFQVRADTWSKWVEGQTFLLGFRHKASVGSLGDQSFFEYKNIFVAMA